MKKKSLIIISSILGFLLVTIAVTTLFSSRAAPLKVLSSTPSDNSKDVSPDSNITIVFNKNPKKANIRFTIEPKTEGVVEIIDKGYVFKPNSPLEKSAIYIVTLGLLDQKPIGVYGFVFQTEGPPLNIPSTAEPEDFVQDRDNLQRQNNPDVFLVNKTPYSNNDFSINSTFTQTPKDHFYFSVSLKGSNKDGSKEAFLDWVKSFGLTDAQISTLDIRYN